MQYKDGLSIVIVNYFCENDITTLVESICTTCTLEKFEFVIVSNSPSDFQWDEKTRQKYNIIIIDSGSNIGFGRAMNLGVAHASYPYVCLSNPDIEIPTGTLEKLYEFFNSTEESVAAISCLIRNSEGLIQNSFVFDNGLDKKSFALHYLKLILPGFIRKTVFRDKAYENKTSSEHHYHEPFEVAGLYGAFLIVRKTAFEALKGFDPDFFMYYEDDELLRHRLPQKYKSMIYPQAEITHQVGKTDKYGLMSDQMQLSFLLFLKKLGYYYLVIALITLSIKYSLLYLHTLIKPRKERREAIRFFKSFKYLGRVLQTPKGYGQRSNCLKLDEIPD